MQSERPFKILPDRVRAILIWDETELGLQLEPWTIEIPYTASIAYGEWSVDFQEPTVWTPALPLIVVNALVRDLVENTDLIERVTDYLDSNMVEAIDRWSRPTLHRKHQLMKFARQAKRGGLPVSVVTDGLAPAWQKYIPAIEAEYERFQPRGGKR